MTKRLTLSNGLGDMTHINIAAATFDVFRYPLESALPC